MSSLIRPSSVLLSSALLVAAVAGPAVGAEESADTMATPGSVEPVAECFGPVTMWEDYDCGYVIVPESRGNGNDRIVKLAYTRFNSMAGEPGAPLIIGTGGPGSTALGHPDSYVNPMTPTLEDRDVILFSQRGTEFSEPYLGCDPYTVAIKDAYAEGMSEQERLDSSIAKLQECVEDFGAQGVDLSAYNTWENAADVADIATALGYDRFDYAGESYGTLLGQFVVRDHGDRLDAVVLDGVVPAAKLNQAQDGADKTQRVFRAIFDACAADQACAESYPDSEAQLVSLFERLEAEPAPIDVLVDNVPATVQMDGTLMINGLYSAIYDPNFLVTLPRAIALAEGGFYDVLANAVSTTLSGGAYARVQHYTVVCSDDPVTNLEEATTADDVLAPYVRLAESNAAEYIQACPVVVEPSDIASLDEPVTSDLPALFVSGALDPTTPESQAAEVATGFANSTEILNPAGAHIQLIRDACFANIVASFLRDPAGAVDASCVDAEPALPPFVVETTVTATSPDGANELTFSLPSDYTQAESAWVAPSNTRYVLPIFLPAGQSPEEAAAAIGEIFALSGFAEVGTGTAGVHEATFLQAEGEVSGLPAVVDVAVVEAAEGTFGVAAVGLADKQTTAREVDFPAAVESLTIDGK